jgi:hypothetical protein
MPYRFKKHYTLDEARALLPQVRGWLGEAADLRGRLLKSEGRMAAMMEAGADLGGRLVNNWVRQMVELRRIVMEFHKRGILVKDVDRGLLDFPSLLGGREVLLCWEKDEEDIQFWHDLESGYAGRERL